MSLRMGLYSMISLLVLSSGWGCGSKKKNSSPPPPPEEQLSLDQVGGGGGEGEGEGEGENSAEGEPPTLVLSEAERTHCLAEQEKTLESWGWNPGRGVEGVIDLLLDEAQQSAPLPRCTP